MMLNPYNYFATIKRVVDGDTVDCLVDLGFYAQVTVRFRILDLDAPEVSTPEGKAARDFARQAFTDKPCLVESHKTDKYGRWLAKITFADGSNFAVVMKEKGFVK